MKGNSRDHLTSDFVKPEEYIDLASALYGDGQTEKSLAVLSKFRKHGVLRPARNQAKLFHDSNLLERQISIENGDLLQGNSLFGSVSAHGIKIDGGSLQGGADPATDGMALAA